MQTYDVKHLSLTIVVIDLAKPAGPAVRDARTPLEPGTRKQPLEIANDREIERLYSRYQFGVKIFITSFLPGEGC